MSGSGNPLWEEHIERLRRLSGATSNREQKPRARRTTTTAEAQQARRGEWTAAPPGRLGRHLLSEIDSYLAFFAIARAD